MKNMELFKRSEIKFIVEKEETVDIMDSLEEVMSYDKFTNKSNHSYKVATLYFDTEEFNLMNMKINKQIPSSYKWKLRLRWYNHDFEDSDIFFLEIKKKTENDLVKKVRVKLNKSEAEVLFKSKNTTEVIKNSRYKKEILDQITESEISPKILIEYERVALVSEENIRVTLDFEIKYRLLNSQMKSYILNPNLSILELKTDKVEPEWLAKKFRSFNLRSRKFSKYKGTGKLLDVRTDLIKKKLRKYKERQNQISRLNN